MASECTSQLLVTYPVNSTEWKHLPATDRAMGMKPSWCTHSQELGLQRKHRPPGPATMAAMTGHSQQTQFKDKSPTASSEAGYGHFLCGVSSLPIVLSDF